MKRGPSLTFGSLGGVELVIWLDVFAARRDKYRTEAIQMLLQWAREQIEPKEEEGRSPL